MLLFGIGSLLPWNAILTALDFFEEKVSRIDENNFVISSCLDAKIRAKLYLWFCSKFLAYRNLSYNPSLWTQSFLCYENLWRIYCYSRTYDRASLSCQLP